MKALAKENETQIQILRTNLDALLKQDTQAAQKREETPSENGFVLLSHLNTASEPHKSVKEMALECVMSEAEVAIILTELTNGKWAGTKFEQAKGVVAHRTIKGDECVLAMWAKDVYALPGTHERILLLIGRAENSMMNERLIQATMFGLGVQGSLADTIEILTELKGRGYVHRDPLEIEAGSGHLWFLQPQGKAYLQKRQMIAGGENKPAVGISKFDTFTTAQKRILTYLDEHGEVTALKFAQEFKMQLQSAEGQLNDLQGGNNKIVFAQWRGPDYVYSLGEEGKKLIVEQHASGRSAKPKAYQEQSKGTDLLEIEVKILLFLRTPGGGDGRMPHEVARNAGINPELAEVHLNHLLQAGLASQHVNIHKGGRDWHRTIAGSEYLATRGLPMLGDVHYPEDQRKADKQRLVRLDDALRALATFEDRLVANYVLSTKSVMLNFIYGIKDLIPECIQAIWDLIKAAWSNPNLIRLVWQILRRYWSKAFEAMGVDELATTISLGINLRDERIEKLRAKALPQRNQTRHVKMKMSRA